MTEQRDEYWSRGGIQGGRKTPRGFNPYISVADQHLEHGQYDEERKQKEIKDRQDYNWFIHGIPRPGNFGDKVFNIAASCVGAACDLVPKVYHGAKNAIGRCVTCKHPKHPEHSDFKAKRSNHKKIVKKTPKKQVKKTPKKTKNQVKSKSKRRGKSL